MQTGATSPVSWLIIAGKDIVLSGENSGLWQHLPVSVDQVLQRHPLGLYQGCELWVAELSSNAVLEAKTLPVRQGIVSGLLDGFVLQQAASLVNWGRDTLFCSRCTGRLRASVREDDRARVCPACGYHVYPVVSPCIIVLIHRQQQLLLAQSVNHPEGLYSLIAGFVEPGESLEQAVAREVLEETGLKVKDIRYQGSQPWPFAHNLMMGFTAGYDSGSLVVDTTELTHADWFTKDNLPQLLPPKPTIARQLIDDFLQSPQAMVEAK